MQIKGDNFYLLLMSLLIGTIKSIHRSISIRVVGEVDAGMNKVGLMQVVGG